MSLGSHITLLACGHTHVPRSVRTSSGLLIVNPGSVGRPAYDFEPMATLAERNGRPDWAHALRTGYLPRHTP